MKDRKGKRCKGVDFLSAREMTEPPEGSGLRSFAALKEKAAGIQAEFERIALDYTQGRPPGRSGLEQTMADQS